MGRQCGHGGGRLEVDHGPRMPRLVAGGLELRGPLQRLQDGRRRLGLEPARVEHRALPLPQLEPRLGRQVVVLHGERLEHEAAQPLERLAPRVAAALPQLLGEGEAHGGQHRGQLMPRHQRGVGAEHVDEYLVRECAAARLAAERAELEPRAHIACGRRDEVAHREHVLPHVGIELRLVRGEQSGVRGKKKYGIRSEQQAVSSRQ